MRGLNFRRVFCAGPIIETNELDENAEELKPSSLPLFLSSLPPFFRPRDLSSKL